MPRAGKGGRYHHGDLRTALIEVAIELIAERGVRDFSVAEASRRLGVAASAPYAHFADRDQLLAAVTVRAYERLLAEIRPALDGIEAPADRLAAMARGYVRFAATNSRGAAIRGPTAWQRPSRQPRGASRCCCSTATSAAGHRRSIGPPSTPEGPPWPS